MADLMGELNGGCTAADGGREQPLFAVVLQERDDSGDNPCRHHNVPYERDGNSLKTFQRRRGGVHRLVSQPHSYARVARVGGVC